MKKEIDWNVLSVSHFDPRTCKCEHEAQNIIHLKNITNQLPNALTNLSRVTKSHIPSLYTQIRVDNQIGQLIYIDYLNHT